MTTRRLEPLIFRSEPKQRQRSWAGDYHESKRGQPSWGSNEDLRKPQSIQRTLSVTHKVQRYNKRSVQLRLAPKYIKNEHYK